MIFFSSICIEWAGPVSKRNVFVSILHLRYFSGGGTLNSSLRDSSRHVVGFALWSTRSGLSRLTLQSCAAQCRVQGPWSGPDAEPVRMRARGRRCVVSCCSPRWPESSWSQVRHARATFISDCCHAHVQIWWMLPVNLWKSEQELQDLVTGLWF